MRMDEGQMGAGLAGEWCGGGSLPERLQLSTLLLTSKPHKNMPATGHGNLDSKASRVSFSSEV